MGRVSRVTRQVRWYVGALMGDSHYRRYLEHHGRTHPGAPALSEADYWRMRHRATEAGSNPRCC